MALSVADSNGHPVWLLYLTHWCVMIEALYFVTAAYCTYQAISSEVRDGADDVAPWFVRLALILWAATPTMSLLVVVLYWGLVWRPPMPLDAIGFIEHGGNLLVILADMGMNRQPLHFRGVYVPIIFGLLYMVLTVTWWACGGDDLYNQVSWGERPAGTALYFAASISVVVPLLHLVAVAAVSTLRKWDDFNDSRTVVAEQAPGGEGGGAAAPGADIRV